MDSTGMALRILPGYGDAGQWRRRSHDDRDHRGTRRFRTSGTAPAPAARSPDSTGCSPTDRGLSATPAGGAVEFMAVAARPPRRMPPSRPYRRSIPPDCRRSRFRARGRCRHRPPKPECHSVPFVTRQFATYGTRHRRVRVRIIRHKVRIERQESHPSGQPRGRRKVRKGQTRRKPGTQSHRSKGRQSYDSGTAGQFSGAGARRLRWAVRHAPPCAGRGVSLAGLLRSLVARVPGHDGADQNEMAPPR
jgi:hypothetical protein